MNLKPIEQLSERQIANGLNLVIKEGIVTEAMTALTGGTFLVALALLLGATNLEIGILAALPGFSKIFQIVAIWLLQKYNNRRAIAVICNICARVPLLLIGMLPLLFSKGTSLQVLIFVLFFFYFFGSIAGANWNSWMKDLVPEKMLGTYFSKRTRLTQTLNVVLSLIIAVSLDYVKKVHPEMEIATYALMFIGGGLIGLCGVWLLSKTPEPATYLPKENIIKLFKVPLKDKNYRKLLCFNSFWAFSVNIATPFFIVFMMKNLNLPLSYIITFGIMGQVAGIFTIKRWGKHSDKYSNKTILKIAGPLYIICILSWPFANMVHSLYLVVLMVALISTLSGAAISGINLSIDNIGLKLASKNESIVYLTAKNMIVACFAAFGPLVGGFLADYFSSRQFEWSIKWNGPHGTSVLPLLQLHSLSFLFIIGGVLAFMALKTLNYIKEEGEIPKELALGEIKIGFKNEIRSKIKREPAFITTFQNRIAGVENRMASVIKWRKTIAQKKTA